MDTGNGVAAAAGEFALEPPQPVVAVPTEAAAGKVRLKPEDLQALDTQVRGFIDEITAHDVHDARFKVAVDRVHSMGSREIEASASVSNRLLERPVGALHTGLFDEKSNVGRSLIELRQQIDTLDPTRQGDLFAPRRLLGFIPFGNRMAAYFDRFRSSQSQLNAIIASLKRGKDELLRDNAAIEQEKVNLWGLMERLEKYVYIGRKLDGELEARAAQLDAVDPDKARVVREEMLFYTRQKVQDLLTQMSVNVQGYLALDVVRRNNLELSKGVDRATTTTVSALRTAVIVAQALTNQKLVLEQVTALNTTTGNLIAGTSQLLREQGTAIQQQAASSTVNLDQLRQAFQNVYAAMDALSEYKGRALASMQTTVDALTQEVSRAQEYVERVRGEAAPGAALPAPGEVRL